MFPESYRKRNSKKDAMTNVPVSKPLRGQGEGGDGNISDRLLK
jgi:hypothetical protein